MSDSDGQQSDGQGSRFPQRRVLVVDDDPTFALLATETLEQATFKVTVAATVPAATEAFASFRPDLVLLDVDLPGGNGFDVCRLIRASPVNGDVPIVLVTGHDDTTSIEKAFEAGASDFLLKPVLWPTLPHRVEFMLRALDNRRALARSEKKNRALLQALPDASVLVDPAGRIVEHLSGSDTVDDRPLVGLSLDEAFPATVVAAARRALAAGAGSTRTTHEFSVRQGAKPRWFEARLRSQPDGTLLIVTCDVTERRKAKARIEFLAYYDVLTGLPNRQLLLMQAAHSIKAAQRDGTQLAVLYLDLDRFKRVNDNLGHALGDALLKNVARRLSSLVPAPSAAPAAGGSRPGPEPHMVARLGGDEFVMLVGGLTEDRQAIEVADRIRTLLGEPFECGAHHLVVTPSIGVAVYPRDSTEIEDLLVKADMAMYLAKDQGRNGHAFFGQSLAVRSLHRLAMESDLRRALEHGDFRLHYQPKLDLASGTLTGVEALLRWQHAERGDVPPDRFIPVAEETGLIIPLGAWVIREVCAQLRRWAQAGFGTLTAAVNVSAQQFLRSDFVDSVLNTLGESGVGGERLELEITESLLMRNVVDTTASLARLRAHGVALSIDDFGTGYSSLGYLQRLPVSALKIDRSFVKDLGRKEEAATICTAIIALARELRLKVIAEGVESEAQLAFLQRQQCDQAQGFLISRPVPAGELETLLRSGCPHLSRGVRNPRQEADTRDEDVATRRKRLASGAK